MSPPLPATEDLGLDSGARRVDALAREILGDSYVHFRLDRISMDEDAMEGEVSLKCVLSRSATDEKIQIEGMGVGLVDALFDGIVARYAGEYPSLKTIKVADFSVRSGIESAKTGRQTDADAVAELVVENSGGTRFTFSHRAASVTRSSARATLDAATFFINSERAYVQLHLALKDAKERRRSDLADKFRGQMGVLVGATSYSEVIERIKAEDEG